MNRKTKTGLCLAAALLFATPCFARNLSLEDAIDLALSGNTSLRVTQKDEITAKENVAEAKGQNGLSATVGDSLAVSKQSDSDRSSSNGITLSGSLPLYSGGKNQAVIHRTELALDAAGLATERERENLKLNVIDAYYNALEAKHTIEVRQDTVNRYQDHLNLTSALYTAGSKARIDVLDMSVQLSNARQELIVAQNNYEVDLARLRDYINIDRTEPLNLTTEFVYTPFLPSVNDAIAYAYENRKDLIADVNKLKQSEESLKEAKAGYLPSLDLSVSTGQTNSFQPSSDSSQDVRGTVGLSWNIFDSGVTRARVKSANNDIDIARLTYQCDKEAADLSVRENYHSMREAEDRFNSTGDAVKLAQENYFIAREKYRAGEGLMVDITDAQESLATAELNEISAKYDYLRYKAAVENAMGVSLTDSERAAADELAPVLLPKYDMTEEQAKLDSGDWDKQKRYTPKAGHEDAVKSKERDKADAAKTGAAQPPEQHVIEPAGRKQKKDAKDIEEPTGTTGTGTSKDTGTNTTNTGSDSTTSIAREMAGE